MTRAWTINPSEFGRVFGHFVICDFRLGGRLRARVKARNNLYELDLDNLLIEEDRAVESIRGGRNFFGGLEFPDVENKGVYYTIGSSEYLDLVHQRIRTLVLN